MGKGQSAERFMEKDLFLFFQLPLAISLSLSPPVWISVAVSFCEVFKGLKGFLAHGVCLVIYVCVKFPECEASDDNNNNNTSHFI